MDEALAALGLAGSPGAIVTCALLLAARVGPIAWLAPYVAPMGSPAIVRTATLAALVAALLGTAFVGAEIPATNVELALALARELTLGLSLAIASSVPVVALEHVGRSLDAWRPSREDAEGLYTRLFAALAAAAFVAIGGLRVVMRALGDGLVSIPLGAPLAAADAQSIALASARLVATAVTFTVSLAAPALVALFAAELGIAIAVRAARWGRALEPALGVRGGLVLGAALLAIAAALPELPALTRWAMDQMQG
jgi:type III secretory pathway component EscT